MSIKTVIIGVVSLVVIGGGAAAYVAMSGDEEEPASTRWSSNEAANEETTFNKLLSQNKSLTCTYSGEDEAGNSNSGTVYLDDGRMRGDFTVVADDGKHKSNILQDSEYQYGWENSSETGFKIALDTLKGSETQESEDAPQQAVAQDQEFNFECSDWAVDESMFEVPGDVEFTDYSAQIEQAQQMQQNAPASCAGITNAEARAACEDAM